MLYKVNGKSIINTLPNIIEAIEKIELITGTSSFTVKKLTSSGWEIVYINSDAREKIRENLQVGLIK